MQTVAVDGSVSLWYVSWDCWVLLSLLAIDVDIHKAVPASNTA